MAAGGLPGEVRSYIIASPPAGEGRRISVVHDLFGLPSPAEAGIAKAGNRVPARIKSGAGFFRIVH